MINIKFSTYIRALIIGLLTLPIACEKTEQTFDYEAVNEASIESSEDSYTLEQFQSLVIEPVITESLVQDTYSYEWRVYGGTSVNKVVSEERNLDYTIDVAPGSYSVLYTITNSNTGLKAFKKFSLTVVGSFYQGWLVTHNYQGQARLGFVRTDGEVFLNPASDINETTYPGTALSAYYSTYGFILYFTTEGAFRFNANDFVGIGSTVDLFSRDRQFEKPIYGLGVISADQFVVDPKGLYASLGGSFFPALVRSPFSDRFIGDYELFPWIYGSGLNTYFYDNKNKQFIQVQYTARIYTIPVGSTTALFNLRNVGKTMIAGGRGRLSTLHHLIMEDIAGRYIYSLSGINPSRNQAVDFGASPDFDKATVFANSQGFDHIYYAYANKIYLYNIIANTAQLLYEFPSGYQVKDMKWGGTPVRRLVVGTNVGDAGEVYHFDIDELGLFANNTFSGKYTGFGDIAHLSFRN